MIYALTLPEVGDVDELRMLEWSGEIGSTFAAGDLIAELETHKVVIEVRAGQAGVLRRTLVAEGDWQKTCQAIALFSDSLDEPLPDGDPGTGEFEAEFMVA